MVNISPTQSLGIGEAARFLINQVEEVRAASEAHSTRSDSLTFRCQLQAFDLAVLLASSKVDQKYYYRSRDGKREALGLGVFWKKREMSAEELKELFARDPELKVFYGQAFGQARGEWQVFGDRAFVCARLGVIRHGDQYEMILRFSPSRQGEWEEVFNLLHQLEMLHVEKEAHHEHEFLSSLPSFELWQDIVREGLDAIRAKDLSKVVLARRDHLVAASGFAATRWVLDLIEKARDTTIYYYQPEKDVAFFGATPELLYRRRVNMIEAEAVAGTRARQPSDEVSLDDVLLSSEKDVKEHRIVTQALSVLLDEQCKAWQMLDPESPTHLRHQVHLKTCFKGELQEGVGDLELMRTLHPTPAIGGYPREEALRFIDHKESFDRGWYAGLIGLLGKDETEIAVGIRSSLQRGSDVFLFAGAGIVDGSDPVAEWDEVTTKMKPMVDIAFGGR